MIQSISYLTVYDDLYVVDDLSMLAFQNDLLGSNFNQQIFTLTPMSCISKNFKSNNTKHHFRCH